MTPDEVLVVDLDAAGDDPRARIERALDPDGGIVVVAVSRDPSLAGVALGAGAEFALLPRDAAWLDETLGRVRSVGAGSRIVLEVPPGGLRFEEVERAVVEHALERHGWNRSRAARELGISRPRLQRKILRYGLRAPGAGPGSA